MANRVKGFIDIHSHILPAMDDGAADMAEAADMLKIAAREEITAMVATPHFVPGISETDYVRVIQAVNGLNDLCSGVAPAITVFPGNELYLIRGAFDSIKTGRCLTLAGSRCVLCELSMSEYPCEECLNELELLLKGGYIPILAHPERYQWLPVHTGFLSAYIKKGCQLQINAGSILGRFGRTAQKMAAYLLAEEMISYAASDCHDTRDRKPGMKEAFHKLSTRYGAKTAEKLTIHQPKSIMEKTRPKF